MYAKTDNANLKKDLSSIELPAKLLNWFSRINKSNINQSMINIYLCFFLLSYEIVDAEECASTML